MIFITMNLLVPGIWEGYHMLEEGWLIIELDVPKCNLHQLVVLLHFPQIVEIPWIQLLVCTISKNNLHLFVPQSTVFYLFLYQLKKLLNIDFFFHYVIYIFNIARKFCFVYLQWLVKSTSSSTKFNIFVRLSQSLSWCIWNLEF